VSVSEEIRARVRLEAQDRCGYCLSQQRFVLGWLEIDHLLPQAKGGTDVENNLWLAYRLCNNYKGVQTEALDPKTGQQIPLFNPRLDNWWTHFCWSEDGTQILGLTPCGRATVNALQLNNAIALTVRRAWVSAGWHPPSPDPQQQDIPSGQG